MARASDVAPERETTVSTPTMFGPARCTWDLPPLSGCIYSSDGAVIPCRSALHRWTGHPGMGRGDFGRLGVRLGANRPKGRAGLTVRPKIRSRLVGAAGFEPTTFWSQTRRATSCATPR